MTDRPVAPMTERLKFIQLATLALATLWASSAYPESMPATDSIWTQSHLTGDWWGARSRLAGNGVTFDLEYTSTYQELVSGTRDKDSGYGGKFDAFINLDSGKLGLWEGGGLRTHIEYRHGDAQSNVGNTLFATNTAQLWPVDSPEELVATSMYCTQQLGERASILAGKFNPVDLLAADPFFGGWGIHRFMNLIFAAPPSGLVPPVFMGAIANVQTEPINWTFMVFDPNDRTNDYFPGDLFSDGVNVSITATRAAVLAERKTAYSVTANYSTADSVDYSTIPPGLETTNTSGAWNVAFQFTHNLQESAEQADANWGFYFKAAVADGNPNYVKASVIAGIGGRALFFGRPQDSFGLGAFYYDLSDELQNSLDPLADFGDEAAIETFYSWSVTPWLHVGGDVQYVDPARRGEDASLIVAVRANIRF
jgi:porin